LEPVDAVFAYDSPADRDNANDPLGIEEVAKLAGTDEEEGVVDAQLGANMEALENVIRDAAKLGYTHYVLDNGYDEVSTGLTSPRAHREW
jgi:hypothetical protein